jgi:HEAT repeat protein
LIYSGGNSISASPSTRTKGSLGGSVRKDDLQKRGDENGQTRGTIGPGVKAAIFIRSILKRFVKGNFKVDEKTTYTAEKPVTPSKLRWRWAKRLALFLAICFFCWEAYLLSPTVRVGVVTALGWVGPPATSVLLGFCQDRSDEVQLAALGVLIAEGPKVVPSLEQALADPDARRREAAAGVLGRIGPAAAPAVPALAELAEKDPAANVRKAATVALGGVGGDDPAVTRALIAPLNDADLDVRNAAFDSLHGFGPKAKAAVPALIGLLKDSDARIRQQAAEGLEQIGPDAREAIPALREALKDPVNGVRREAGEALEAIGESESPGKD